MRFRGASSKLSKWQAIGFTLILVLILFTPNLKADAWDENYEDGKTALERGEWDKAIESLQKALSLRPKPDPQATTSSLKLVEYLPYYYLGQAYLFSGHYELALRNFQESEKYAAVKETNHLHRFKKYKEMAQRLIQFSELQMSKAKQDFAFDKKLSEFQSLIQEERYGQAQNLLKELKRLYKNDQRLLILEKWVKMEKALKDRTAELGKNAEQHFYTGLEYYILGQYDEALAEFKVAEKLDPNFSAAKNWTRKTQTEMERLKLADKQSKKEEASPPEILEKIITQTIAPVFVIRNPAEAVTQIRSKYLRLSGQAGDDHGIDYIEFTVNGKPLLNPSGEKIMIRPQATDNPKKFSFSANIPLQKGENQIVLVGYDVDSTRHRSTEIFTVIRKPPIYQTSAFGITVGSLLLLGFGGLFITRSVKYRIAIVNKYNPYIAGAPIRNEEMFFGRERLLQRILNTLHNNSLMIYGPRRIGKTSLQHQLKRRLENLEDSEYYYIPVLIDLQGTSENRFFTTMMEDILEVCKSQINSELSFEFYEKKEDYSGRDFSRDLKRLLQFLSTKTDKKLKLVLLMDEVDELNKYSEQVNQKLRSVFMKTFAENLVAVMSGSYIRKNWESEGSPWYNFFEEIEVPPLEKKEAEELIRRPVKGIFNYDQKAVEKIVEYSQGKPYIIQRFCINVINRIIEAKRRRVTVEDVEAVRVQILDKDEQMEI